MVIAVASVQHAIEGRARVLIDMVVANNGAVFHIGKMFFRGTAGWVVRCWQRVREYNDCRRLEPADSALVRLISPKSRGKKPVWAQK
jgi:hypothetical protein